MRRLRRPLVLMLGRADDPKKDLAAMTLGWMCEEGGVEFDAYYASEHGEGGLFAPHGSTVIGGHHIERIARALATFNTTVIRIGEVSIFDSLICSGAKEVIDCQGDLIGLYERMGRALGTGRARCVVAFDEEAYPAIAALYPECVYRRAWAVPLALNTDELRRLREMGVETVWTVARRGADVSNWIAAGFKVETAFEFDTADPAQISLEIARRWRDKASAFDLHKPDVARYLMPFSIRENRLPLLFRNDGEAARMRDHLLRLSEGKGQRVVYGQWFGDPPLIPFARRPMAYEVVEPCRPVLTVFSRCPARLPQPERSCFDLEPSDDQLKAWASEGKILATWVLHSGELPHDDALLGFLDWAAMTKVKIGSGVHWQRYYVSPDLVELMHVPVEEGGVLGLVEPVLHSTGWGIMWESAGDADKIAAMMKEARERIARVAGERFAPRGVYLFADHAAPGDHETVGDEQISLWRAIKRAGFEYVITSVRPGASGIIFREGDFVVLTQAGKPYGASPLVRGDPTAFAAVERKLAEAGKPGWLIGAIDSIIHGCPVYMCKPFDRAPRINEFYDYIRRGGVTGRVISATPHTIARYARLLDDLERRCTA